MRTLASRRRLPPPSSVVDPLARAFRAPRPTPRAARLTLGLALGFGISSTACQEPAPRFTEPMTLGGTEISAEVLNRGARIYALYCVSCHGVDGSGQGNAARSLPTPPRDFRDADFRYVSGPEGSLPTDEDLDHTIREGRIDTGMPAWNALTPEDRVAVRQYLKTLSPRWTTEAPVGGAPPSP